MSDYHPNLDGPAEPIGLAMPPTEAVSQIEVSGESMNYTLYGIAEIKDREVK